MTATRVIKATKCFEACGRKNTVVEILFQLRMAFEEGAQLGLVMPEKLREGKRKNT
ncbi:hypothetical protein EST38_g13272 [Candolleomyces aberdarensis]|uniref:Uncharacterized protein n=1 Tax=Candolleomyces aberdarensis TaxID=2316362 RepID=A0A4Q2D081_9AGAR|nr:hypothetical protein EST38_g13272 [Candolleomyces aberdarensis]